MPTERRYTEQQIAAIFEKAAEAQKAARRGTGEGLTLAELQEIGAEAGLLPEMVAHAAALADRPVTALPTRRYLGLPIGVARTVELPGSFSDAAWDGLVADLRSTFHAKGKTGREGGLRIWRNGNLQATVEPTGAGHRLRLSTLKSDAAGTLGTGLVFFVAGLVLVALNVLGWENSLADSGVMFALLGLFAAGVKALQLPRWAEERARQMDEVAARAAERSAGAVALPSEAALPVAAPALSLDALLDAPGPADTRYAHGQRTRE